MPDILDHAEFDLLEEMEKERIREAMKNPEERVKFLAGVVYVQRKESQAGREFCRTDCKPKLEGRLGHLERFKSWLLGIGIGISGLATILGVLYAIFGRH